MSIPIIIICRNNYKYVDNTVKQLTKINNEYVKQIIIVDNKSTEIDTINYLKTVNVNVIWNQINAGPWIDNNSNNYNYYIYNMMPDKFILTDPDLEFHKDIPSDFIEQLSILSDNYKTWKIGMALDISEPEKFYSGTYCINQSIYEWEHSQFWKNQIPNDKYVLYNAAIDTTWCLVNKQHIHDNYNIRVAGNFTAKHLPWYIDNPLINVYESYKCYNTATTSTTGKIIIPHININYIHIKKNNEDIFIKNRSDDQNLLFWKNIFSNWENDTFAVFDTFLKKDKIFIDIGGWIGTTCIYGARKSKYVYVVEADEDSFNDLESNCKINSSNNITFINNAIFNESNKDVLFGKNKYLPNSKLNDSTSHIYIDNTGSGKVIKTITVNDLFKNYSINPKDVSLIKVDIEGGEEHILNDLYYVYQSYNIPLYISFHYSWWINKDLNRFTFLTTEHKNNIIRNPFISITFS